MSYEEVNPNSTANVRATASDEEEVLLTERGGHAEVVQEAVHRRRPQRFQVQPVCNPITVAKLVHTCTSLVRGLRLRSSRWSARSPPRPLVPIPMDTVVLR